MFSVSFFLERIFLNNEGTKVKFGVRDSGTASHRTHKPSQQYSRFCRGRSMTGSGDVANSFIYLFFIVLKKIYYMHSFLKILDCTYK